MWRLSRQPGLDRPHDIDGYPLGQLGSGRDCHWVALSQCSPPRDRTPKQPRTSAYSGLLLERDAVVSVLRIVNV